MSDETIYDQNHIVKNSALGLFLGDRLGSGASRIVYALEHDDSKVLKVEYAGRTFHNQTEWLIWKEMKGWPISDWFAPCYDIDSYGNCLIQGRTQPFDCEHDWKIALQRTRGGVLPDVFGDVHYGNFGMLNGRVVCHDYGYHTFFEQIARSLSINAGYIKFDEPDTWDEKLDYVDGDQFVLDI